MLLLDVWKVPIWLSLTVIATWITVAVTASLWATRHQQQEAVTGGSEDPDLVPR